MKHLFAVNATLVLLASAVVHADLPPVIPRELLFGSLTNSKCRPDISPNGRYLSYVVRSESEVKCRKAEEAFLAKYLGGRFEPASEKEKCDGLMK